MTQRVSSHLRCRVLVNDLDADVAGRSVIDSRRGGFPADLTDRSSDRWWRRLTLRWLDIVVNNTGYIWHSAFTT